MNARKDCDPQQVLRLGTRGSLLARMQSQWVADQVERTHPNVRVELVICTTTGDRIQDRSLADAGGKGLFTKELEEALLENRIDFAVHSFKDVPVTMPLVSQQELAIAAVPVRLDPRDVIVARGHRQLSDLANGARVGTGSMRRRCQILAMRPDLRVSDLRGNIDTRVKKLFKGDYDAIVLAAAGLMRAGMYDEDVMTPIKPMDLLPAAGQGALAIQCRRRDLRTRRLLEVLDDRRVRLCVEVERAVVAALDGDCHSPIAAYACVDEVDRRIILQAAVGARGGKPPVIRAAAEADIAQPAIALRRVLDSLARQGAAALLGTQRGVAHPDPQPNVDANTEGRRDVLATG